MSAFRYDVAAQHELEELYPEEVSGSLCHVSLSKHLALVAHADVTGPVAERSCEAALPKVTQQQDSAALHLLLAVCHLHGVQPMWCNQVTSERKSSRCSTRQMMLAWRPLHVAILQFTEYS